MRSTVGVSEQAVGLSVLSRGRAGAASTTEGHRLGHRQILHCQIHNIWQLPAQWSWWLRSEMTRTCSTPFGLAQSVTSPGVLDRGRLRRILGPVAANEAVVLAPGFMSCCSGLRAGGDGGDPPTGRESQVWARCGAVSPRQRSSIGFTWPRSRCAAISELGRRLGGRGPLGAHKRRGCRLGGGGGHLRHHL